MLQNLPPELQREIADKLDADDAVILANVLGMREYVASRSPQGENQWMRIIQARALSQIPSAENMPVQLMINRLSVEDAIYILRNLCLPHMQLSVKLTALQNPGLRNALRKCTDVVICITLDMDPSESSADVLKLRLAPFSLNGLRFALGYDFTMLGVEHYANYMEFSLVVERIRGKNDAGYSNTLLAIAIVFANTDNLDKVPYWMPNVSYWCYDKLIRENIHIAPTLPSRLREYTARRGYCVSSIFGRMLSALSDMP